MKSVVVTEQGQGKTSYFYIPFLMKRQILPLTNVKMSIDEIHLNDKNVAPFICDVISWLHIQDPIKAAERLDFNHAGGVFGSLREDLNNIVQSIARAVAMDKDLLDIMRNRKNLSEALSKDVDEVLQAWGIDLVNLEVNDIRDDKEKGSRVIGDYEVMRRAEIASISRKQIAEKDREAVESEQDNKQKSEVAKATADEIISKRQIERNKNVELAQVEKEREVAKQNEVANVQKVAAENTLKVGLANVEKEATIKNAEGKAEAIRITGEKQAEVTRLTGSAEASATEAKGLAEAKIKDAMAEALKKFNESGISLEQIKAWVQVQIANAEAQGKVAENANINIVSSGKGGSLLGLPLNAETGFDLGQMLKGIDLGKLAEMFKGKPKE